MVMVFAVSHEVCWHFASSLLLMLLRVTLDGMGWDAGASGVD